MTLESKPKNQKNEINLENANYFNPKERITR